MRNRKSRAYNLAKVACMRRNLPNILRKVYANQCNLAKDLRQSVFRDINLRKETWRLVVLDAEPQKPVEAAKPNGS